MKKKIFPSIIVTYIAVFGDVCSVNAKKLAGRSAKILSKFVQELGENDKIRGFATLPWETNCPYVKYIFRYKKKRNGDCIFSKSCHETYNELTEPQKMVCLLYELFVARNHVNLGHAEFLRSTIINLVNSKDFDTLPKSRSNTIRNIIGNESLVAKLLFEGDYKSILSKQVPNFAENNKYATRLKNICSELVKIYFIPSYAKVSLKTNKKLNKSADRLSSLLDAHKIMISNPTTLMNVAMFFHKKLKNMFEPDGKTHYEIIQLTLRRILQSANRSHELSRPLYNKIILSALSQFFGIKFVVLNKDNSAHTIGTNIAYGPTIILQEEGLKDNIHTFCMLRFTKLGSQCLKENKNLLWRVRQPRNDEGLSEPRPPS